MDSFGIDSPWLPPANDNRNRRKTDVNWEGKRVTEKEGIALNNLFNHLFNYFGQPDGEPKVTFNIDSLDRSRGKDDDDDEADDSDKSKSTSLSIWKGELKFIYKMQYKNRETSQKLNYVSMDLCVDLTPKEELKFGEHDMKGYGITWVYAYVPKYTMETVIKYFEDGTGFKASKRGLILDENRNMVTFEAKLLFADDATESSSFWIPNEENQHDNYDDDDDGKQFSRVGTVQETFKNPVYQLIIRCIGIFTVTAEVYRSSSREGSGGGGGPRSASGRGQEEEARLSFTLVSVRMQGIVNNLAPVVYDPRHCTQCNIDDNLVCWD